MGKKKGKANSTPVKPADEELDQALAEADAQTAKDIVLAEAAEPVETKASEPGHGENDMLQIEPTTVHQAEEYKEEQKEIKTYRLDHAALVAIEEKGVPQLTKKTKVKEPAGVFFAVQRIAALFLIFLIFVPSMNPAKISVLVNKNLSLFTSAVSYPSLVGDVGRGFRAGWIEESSFVVLYVGAILAVLGIIGLVAGSCMSLGNNKLKKRSFLFSLIGSVVHAGGLAVIYVAYTQFADARKQDKVEAAFPACFWIYVALAAVILATTIIAMMIVPKPEAEEKCEMETKFKLFLMFLPFAILTFVFCYLPLWGWRVAFFDYQVGDTLSMDKWVGFKWFKHLFENAATRRDLLSVMRNTLAMSGLGIITSWLPLAFAVLLTEISNIKFRRFVQTFTTIPNFISWILVYTIAIAIFAPEGFINSMTGGSTNYLMGDSFTWLKMLAWGTWKGIGWSAIIYIAGISGIDRQLYDAAHVDGANRFQRIWHVTLPGLIPTYMVMLLLGIAGMLSNGLDQYLVFSNASNMEHMQVLDLYVYKLGIEGGAYPLSVVIGMAKSIISVVLLFMANGVSKLVRKESII